MKRLIDKVSTLLGKIQGAREESFQDYSFMVNYKAQYNSKKECKELLIELRNGDFNADYELFYQFDGNTATRLYNGQQMIPQGGFINFRRSKTLVFRIEGLGGGHHTMHLELRTERYSQSIFEEVILFLEDFDFNTVMDIQGKDSSYVGLTLLSGDKNESYSIWIDIDGKDSGKMHLPDFSTNPYAQIALPVLSPGEHQLLVMVSDGRHEKYYPMSFVEPLRYPDFTLRVTLDKDGDLVIYPESNPYGLTFQVLSFLTMSGNMDFISYEGESVTAPKRVQRIKNMTFRRLFRHDGRCDNHFKVAERKGMETSITSKTVQSAIYKESKKNNGFIFNGYETISYKITEESVELELALEPFEGMNIKIHNDYEFLTVNGTKLDKGVWELPSDDQQNEYTCG